MTRWYLPFATGMMVLGCRGAGDPSARTPRDAMEILSRCALDDPPMPLDQAHFEGAIRVSLHTDLRRFVTRAGRCDDSLSVRGSIPPCLARLHTAWTAMLPMVQSPTRDAIAIEQAIRHVGNGWTEALTRCP